MENDLETTVLAILRESFNRILSSKLACNEMRYSIQTTREIIRATRQMIIESDVAIERLKFIPNSHPCQQLLSCGGAQSGPRLSVRNAALGLDGRGQAEIDAPAA